ncbi:hypothetical protein VTN96DRAFT_6188 [Rasamsonia emersonii]
MKSIPSILLLALPLAALVSGAPSPNPDPNPNPNPRPNPRANPNLTKRDEVCEIIGNDGAVNCRACPSFSCEVITTVNPGEYWDFSCYAVGDCYEGNWHPPGMLILRIAISIYHWGDYLPAEGK